MTNQRLLDVGTRIRELREQHGLSLRALAEQCGLSINAISRIERGENSPTVTSLHRLATALKVPITDLFKTGSDVSTIIIRRNRRPRSRGEGILIESLGVGLPGQRIEPFLMTLAPGACAGEEPISHKGEEFVFCVEGEIEYLVDREWQRLEAGDSLVFQASQSHLCRNAGLEKAVVLFVIQALEEDYPISRQQHMMMVESIQMS